MAHELSIRADGMVEMAFIGSRDAIWHGLGQELSVGADIDTWKREAGMDWDVKESSIEYHTAMSSCTYPDRKALYRSDTLEPLSIVGNDFKVVQPSEILEFFRDLTEKNGMVLSTAGCLFGGKRFWALADTGKSVNVIDGDPVLGHLLLTSAVDGTLATTAKFVSTRVVCNNTLTVALDRESKNMIKRTHKIDFDPKDVKIDLGLLDKAWDSFTGDIKKLSEIKVSDDAALAIYQKLFFKPNVLAADQGWGVVRKVNDMMELYHNGTGANITNGTAWGVLNAVTEGFTHGSGKRNPSHQFWESYCGVNSNVKLQAFNEILKLAA